jgi:hypothetical protein
MNARLAKPIPLGLVYCDPGWAFCDAVIDADQMPSGVEALIRRCSSFMGVSSRRGVSSPRQIGHFVYTAPNRLFAAHNRRLPGRAPARGKRPILGESGYHPRLLR